MSLVSGNNMYFQLFRDRKKELSIKIDPKSISKTTDLVNNFPEQMSSLAILPLLRLKKRGGPRHGS
jgi:hypothetical protein